MLTFALLSTARLRAQSEPEGGSSLDEMPPPPELEAEPKPAATGAKDASWGGSWRTRVATDIAHDRRDEDIAALYSAINLQLQSGQLGAWSAQVAGRLEYEGWTKDFKRRGTRTTGGVELREATVSGRWSSSVVVAGNQVIRWGVLDWLSQNDVINPIDFRRGPSDTFEIPFIPIPALRATQTLSSFSIEGVYVPFFSPHRLYVTGSDWALDNANPTLLAVERLLHAVLPAKNEDQAQSLLVATNPPDHGPANGSVGARVGVTTSHLEAHLNAHFGWNRAPIITWDPAVMTLLQLGSGLQPDAATATALAQVDRKLAAGEPLVSLKYRRRTQLGADSVLTLDPFLFKLELAFSPNDLFYTRDLQSVLTPSFAVAGGIEYQLEDRLSAGIEALDRHLFDRAPAGAHYLFTNQDSQTLAGFVRASFFDDKILFEGRGQYEIRQESYLALAQLSYHHSGAHEVGLGALFLGGRPFSLGGTFDHNDEIFTTYKWSF
jgi:hypothetical protein